MACTTFGASTMTTTSTMTTVEEAGMDLNSLRPGLKVVIATLVLEISMTITPTIQATETTRAVAVAVEIVTMVAHQGAIFSSIY